MADVRQGAGLARTVIVLLAASLLGLACGGDDDTTATDDTEVSETTESGASEDTTTTTFIEPTDSDLCETYTVTEASELLGEPLERRTDTLQPLPDIAPENQQACVYVTVPPRDDRFVEIHLVTLRGEADTYVDEFGATNGGTPAAGFDHAVTFGGGVIASVDADRLLTVTAGVGQVAIDDAVAIAEVLVPRL